MNYSGFYFERQSETLSERYNSDHITYTTHVIIANQHPFLRKLNLYTKLVLFNPRVSISPSLLR
jgi:hypothetical protein